LLTLRALAAVRAPPPCNELDVEGATRPPVDV